MPGVIANIDVPDLERAIRFYRDGLGFEYRRALFNHSVAELSADPVLVYLILKDAGTPAIPGGIAGRDYSPHWTPVHLDVVVEDMDAALPRALDAGATMSGELVCHQWGNLAALRDPFGHGICLVQFLGRGYALVED